MSTLTNTSTYNYETFIGDDDFLSFQSGPKVGSHAPNPEVFDLDANQWRPLNDFQQGGDLVIEFGSFS